jgi:hypothetical protein
VRVCVQEKENVSMKKVLYIAECQELKKHTKQKTYSISGSESGVNTKPAIII